MSIRPEWVAKILNGEKTLEIRKSMPKCDLPIDVYIYCTKNGEVFKNANGQYHSYKNRSKCVYKGRLSNGVVAAKFTLNKVEEIKCITTNDGFAIERYVTDTMNVGELMIESRVNFQQLKDYLYYSNGYAWHIDNLVILDKPKELREFRKHFSTGNCWTCKIFGNGCKTCVITKTPQSWCYVEV